MIGTGTAILIGAGLSAGAQVHGARASARSSDRATAAASAAQQQATQTQSESDREALEFLKEQYRRRLEEDEPFRQFRSQALEELRMLLGLGPTGGYARKGPADGGVGVGARTGGLFSPLTRDGGVTLPADSRRMF